MREERTAVLVGEPQGKRHDRVHDVSLWDGTTPQSEQRTCRDVPRFMNEKSRGDERLFLRCPAACLELDHADLRRSDREMDRRASGERHCTAQMRLVSDDEPLAYANVVAHELAEKFRALDLPIEIQ